jgi:NAD(P) transhydrogenase subunit alpha
MNRTFTLAIGVLLLCCAMQSPGHGQVSTPDSAAAVPVVAQSGEAPGTSQAETHAQPESDYWSLIFVFMLSTFIGMGVIARVSRLLHTPLMSLTNAISAIAVVGSIIVTGSDYPIEYRILGAIALFASMTNIVSGFLITDRMLKMFKQTRRGNNP